MKNNKERINKMLSDLDQKAEEINSLKASDFNDLKFMIREYEELWETIELEFGDELDEEQEEAVRGKHFNNLEFFTKFF